MDDILTYSKREDHTGKLIDLFKAVMRNGLKMSPRKCKLFKKSLVFMGLTMMTEDGMAKMKPLKSRLLAILKVKPSTTVKECRSLCGMINCMSIFLPSLQQKLIPIYFITGKGVPFYWGDEQQKAFDSIKQDVMNAPVLLMPNATGHFFLSIRHFKDRLWCSTLSKTKKQVSINCLLLKEITRSSGKV